MSEMKLIMERWDNYVNEQFEACESPFRVGDLMLATDVAKYLDDQEALNKKEEQIANSKFKGYIDNAKKLAIPLANLGFGVASAATGSVTCLCVQLNPAPAAPVIFCNSCRDTACGPANPPADCLEIACKNHGSSTGGWGAY